VAAPSEWALAYLEQARADMRGADLVQAEEPSVLAMLVQMVLEKLGKAALLRSGQTTVAAATSSHAAATRMVQLLSNDRRACRRLDWQPMVLRAHVAPIVARLERAQPQLAAGAPVWSIRGRTPLVLSSDRRDILRLPRSSAQSGTPDRFFDAWSPTYALDSTQCSRLDVGMRVLDRECGRLGGDERGVLDWRSRWLRGVLGALALSMTLTAKLPDGYRGRGAHDIRPTRCRCAAAVGHACCRCDVPAHLDRRQRGVDARSRARRTGHRAIRVVSPATHRFRFAP
jgi:hypothetical protein